MERILVIANDVELCTSVKETLLSKGFHAEFVRHSETGITRALDGTNWLIAVDAPLPRHGVKKASAKMPQDSHRHYKSAQPNRCAAEVNDKIISLSIVSHLAGTHLALYTSDLKGTDNGPVLTKVTFGGDRYSLLIGT